VTLHSIARWLNFVALEMIQYVYQKSLVIATNPRRWWYVMTAIILLIVLPSVRQLVQKKTRLVLSTFVLLVTMEIRLLARMSTKNLISNGNATANMDISRVITLRVKPLVQTLYQMTVICACHLLLDTVIMLLFVAQVMVESAFLRSLATAKETLPTALTRICHFLVPQFVPILLQNTWIHVSLIVDFNVIMVMLLFVKTMWMSLDHQHLTFKSNVNASVAYSLVTKTLALNRALMLNQFLVHHAHLL
jgi:hypothetical protein